MSDTDIYKKREPMPYGNRNPKRSGRRRHSTSTPRAFDEQTRKRRSKNSGFRRLLHLYRKKDNEKVFWWTVLATIVAVLALLATWQFVIREHIIRQQEKSDDYLQRQKPLFEQPQPSAAE
jgi:hypothetical protein